MASGIIPSEEHSAFRQNPDIEYKLRNLSDSLNLIAQHPADNPDGQPLREWLDTAGFILWDIADQLYGQH